MTLQTSESQRWFYHITKISYFHDKDGNIKYNKKGEPIYFESGFDYISKDCWEAKLYEKITYQGISHRIIKIKKEIIGEPDKLWIVDAKEKNIPTINKLTAMN